METLERRKKVGEAIRVKRCERGFSQQTLAYMIGSSKAHIWRIEKGKVSVGLDDLGRIADALDVSLASFF